MTKFKFTAIRARQADGHDVFSFAATPQQVLAFSEIERVGRQDDGQLKGFQRHQIASHIKEIRDYFVRDDALLPNAVIIAFIDGIKAKDRSNGTVELEIDATKAKPGFVVDGQQRLSALSGIDKPGFQVFVSALLCKDYNELRQQFVLINNTRPLPKTLIYELLPTVEGLPERFTARKFSARIVDRLNFTRSSALFSEIRQHTNPKGVISDTAMQRLIMNSVSDGAIRDFIRMDDYEERAFQLVNEYFEAIRTVFGSQWIGMTPRTSRLKHGAGIVAMGFVMELLYSAEGATTREQFERALRLIKPYTAWTSGQWNFGNDDICPWNGIQNTPGDIDALANHLVRLTKRELRKPRRVANG
ncbi:DGQHR domain-containing protein DpdB [Variovorax sp. J22R133]|uniref:DGQHR domain-containing protein DpdB n=1 Tax=Variovorax brevis TaxID=3053503 RepID=UPI00257499A5|nr:DGQHR domain-containing protein DpdB [Variovorax sp. J22R133]MDM0117518.1 DGQHR domain-containing protein DpdB [Variovorax sp. J22R133]